MRKSGLRWLSFPSLGLLLIFMFILSACGSNAGSGTGGKVSNSGTVTPKPSATTGKGFGTSHGCPSDAVVDSQPVKANVQVQPSGNSTTATAHVGDVVEIRLPFGHKWTGPASSQGVLELQKPSGYAVAANNVCVWRFIAKGTGTTQLQFMGEALCKPGSMCPMFIIDMPVIVDVK